MALRQLLRRCSHLPSMTSSLSVLPTAFAGFTTKSSFSPSSRMVGPMAQQLDKFNQALFDLTTPGNRNKAWRARNILDEIKAQGLVRGTAAHSCAQAEAQIF